MSWPWPKNTGNAARGQVCPGRSMQGAPTPWPACSANGSGSTTRRAGWNARLSQHGHQWGPVTSALTGALGKGSSFTAMSLVCADLCRRTSQSIHGDDTRDVLGRTVQAHPVGTHPSLAARLQSLNTSLSDIGRIDMDGDGRTRQHELCGVAPPEGRSVCGLRPEPASWTRSLTGQWAATGIASGGGRCAPLTSTRRKRQPPRHRPNRTVATRWAHRRFR